MAISPAARRRPARARPGRRGLAAVPESGPRRGRVRRRRRRPGAVGADEDGLPPASAFWCSTWPTRPRRWLRPPRPRGAALVLVPGPAEALALLEKGLPWTASTSAGCTSPSARSSSARAVPRRKGQGLPARDRRARRAPGGTDAAFGPRRGSRADAEASMNVWTRTRRRGRGRAARARRRLDRARFSSLAPVRRGPLLGWAVRRPVDRGALGAAFEALTLEELPLGGCLNFSAPVAAGVAAWLAAGPAAMPGEAAFPAGLFAGWAHARVERVPAPRPRRPRAPREAALPRGARRASAGNWPRPCPFRRP